MPHQSLKSNAGKLILFATILASGMEFMAGSTIGIALPKIQSQFGASVNQIQWIVNSYALVVASLILISGSIGDHFGRKKIYCIGIATFTIASALSAFSPNVNALILFQALMGLGAAMTIPESLAIINATFVENERGRAIGLWSGMSAGVVALGPFLGGILVQAFSWPAVFIINIPLGLLALIISLKFVPESRNVESSDLDILGTVLIVLGLFGLSFGLIQNSPVLWVGIIFLAGFVWHEIKSKNPLVPISIFKSELVVGANLATLFLYFALSGTIFFLVLNFQQVQGYSPAFAGLALLPPILLITFLSGPGGSLADKIGPRLPMILGPLIVSIGLGSMVFAGQNVNYFVSFFPGLVLFGLGMAIVIAPLTKSALEVDIKYSGSASGVNNATSRVAGLLAVALLGAIFLAQFENSLKQKTTQPQILSQSAMGGGIVMPKSFDLSQISQAENAIKGSFVDGFKLVMGINASLAFLAALVAYFTIKNPKRG